MSIAAMLEPIAGNGETVTLPADEWLQGRTLYGGASALVRIAKDGAVEIRNGAQDIGTGTRTVDTTFARAGHEIGILFTGTVLVFALYKVVTGVG